MKISYCTTCHNRLWQLKHTLLHNLSYTIPNEIEICILIYNDKESYDYLKENYSEYIKTKRLKLLDWRDTNTWSCGYVKHLSHLLGTGKALFNLDADNFIDDTLNSELLTIQPKEIIITKQSEWKDDGRSGRIGIHKDLYGKAKYRDRGRSDDGDFISQCIALGAKVKQIPCKIPPISNNQ